MARHAKDLERDSRLRELIELRYGYRGKYSLLENASSISAQKWKNFDYERQSATPEMIEWWCKQYREDEQWLMTGVTPPSQTAFPFSARIPGFKGKSTVGERLNWVIGEWAAPAGEDLFKYLERKSQYLERESGKRIPASEWAKVVLRQIEPTLEMVQVVCEHRQIFTEWVILGRVCRQGPAVDPDDDASVKKWMEWRDGYMDKLAPLPKTDTQRNPAGE